jgi:hypothetical protein
MSDPILKEWKLSTVGKLFAVGIGAWMAGNASRMKIRGTPKDVAALKKALMNSKRFQAELRKPGATAESVIKKLGLAKMSAKEFEKATGVPWPL